MNRGVIKDHCQTIDVLDHGFVRLDDYMADEISVVNSARVSLGKRSNFETDENFNSRLKMDDVKLIEFLMKNQHGTPFEHNSFRWHIKCPIFVAREWMRHRIGSFNEMSGRYSELPEEFYVPEYVRTQVGKPGQYEYEPVSETLKLDVQRTIRMNSQECFRDYQWMIKQDVAKEVARMVLPVNTYTQFYWTVNARALMNFLHLRNAGTAQWEIQQYAEEIESLFSRVMPSTYAAFELNNRVAP